MITYLWGFGIVIFMIIGGLSSLRSRLDKSMDDHDPKMREAASDIQRDIDRGRAGF